MPPLARGSKGSPTDDLVGPVALKVTPDPQVPLAATPATTNVMRPLVPLSLAIAVLLVGVAQAQFFRGLSNLFSGASNFFGGGNKFVDDGTQVGTRVWGPCNYASLSILSQECVGMMSVLTWMIRF